jgi:CRP/FNR family transcriptional regulator, cyclic AMP receptor protein
VRETVSGSLAVIALFSDLAGNDLRHIEKSCRWHLYSPGEQILAWREESDDIFLVISGKIRVLNHSLMGREITFEDRARGTHFGEKAAFDGEPRAASVAALSDCLIAVMAPEHFLEVFAAHPSVALRVTRELGYDQRHMGQPARNTEARLGADRRAG